MYRIGQRQKQEKRHKKTKWFIWAIIVILIIIAAVFYVLSLLKPNTTITQSAPTVKKLTYDSKETTKTYEQEDFTITLPISWQAQPRPVGQYQSYTWKNINKYQNSEELTVYEDKIPLKLAVNRAIILEPANEAVTIKGGLSDNCVQYTRNGVLVQSSRGVPAKWQGVEFLCDQSNAARDVVGTSSAQGVNTVILKSPTTGKDHKYFFVYTNSSINGNYDVFTDALTSFKVK